MGSLLRLRIKSFFSDIALIMIINIIFYFVLMKLHIISKPESYSRIRNWVAQGYYLLCFIYIPAKTVGMKIFKLSYTSIGNENDISLWDVMKFYFFQMMFIFPLIMSVMLMIQDRSGTGFLIILGIVISLLDLLPFFTKKDHLFLHDKFSKIKIDRAII